MSKNLAEQQIAAVKEAARLTKEILQSKEFQQFCEEIVKRLGVFDLDDEQEFLNFGFDGYWGLIEHEQENLIAIWGGLAPLDSFLKMYSGWWNQKS